ncbi:glycosyltransferase [Lichenihabitans psoromatis]|uniref:glycosyltransferase n=1 Tax=Lichenihabitans psoromatis TaxID=2528642 RepID=UPI003CCB370C
MLIGSICLATDSLEPSGVGEHMLALAGALKRDYDVVLACPPSPGGRILLDRGARLGVGLRLLPPDEAAMIDWFHQDGIALLHVHAGIGWEGHALAAMGRAAGIPAVVRTEHLPDMITDAAQRHLHRDGIALVDRIVCVSEASARSYRDVGVPNDRLAVIRNGHDPRTATRSRAAVRADLGLSAQLPMLLTAARFTAQKDHATLIEAVPAVLARFPDACFVLAGSGPLEATIAMQIAAQNLSASVRLLGQRDDIPDLLGAADLLVLPSRFEGLPLTILEAMAAGVPVVATNVGGTDEAAVDGVTGLLVPPGEPARLAAAIQAMLEDPARAARYGRAARKRFQTSFTAARMGADMAQLYQGLGVVPRSATTADRMDGMKPDKTRIGFIGAGGIAQRHLGVLAGFDDVTIAAFADPARERATEAAERFGARSYGDVDAMLAAEQLDAVFICVPPFAHGAPERAAIAKGLPFFVEKPLALDIEIAEAIGREVAAAGLITGCGYHWRYLDTVDEAKHILADNPARLLSGYWLDGTPPPQWWWKQDQSGGQMVEQTTHIVDLARYLVGDVDRVFGLAEYTTRDDFPGLDVATASTATLQFASGAVANLASTCLLRWGHRIGLHIFGDGLAIELTDHDLMVDVGRGRPVRHAEGDPVWREDRDFIDAVRGGPNHIRCPYPEALATHRVALAIQRSAASGQPVDLRSSVRETAHV